MEPQPASGHPERKTPVSRQARRIFRIGLLRYSATELLGALVLLLVTSPIAAQLAFGRIVERLLTTIVLCSAVLAVGGRRRTLSFGIVLGALAVGGQWADHFWKGVVPLPVIAMATLLFVAYVVIQLLRFVLRAPTVTSEVLSAGISAYLLLAIIWGQLYVAIAHLVPGSFAFTGGTVADQSMNGYTALYFSLVTLSTVGYGDIVPVSPAARMLASTEALTGLFYVTVLIARLVAMYSAEEESGAKDAPESE